MTIRGDTVRAFVALDVPDRVRERIRGEQARLRRELPRARWTRPEGQHLTLAFLGDTAVRVVPALAAAIATEVRGLLPVQVALGGAGFFPSPRRPRVAWLGGTADGGSDLAAAVGRAVAAAGFEADRRRWTLHLTQARLQRPWPRAAVERFLDWGRGLEIDGFTCPEVMVFSSDLRPEGAVYTPLERIPLG